MRIAVISVTEKGRVISEKIAAFLTGHSVSRYCFYKHCDSGAKSFDKMGELVEQLFPTNDALVFICACGVAVRVTAPLVKSKAADPAVVVVDDMRRFAISLLSGHLGGANRLAEIVAEAISAQPVITTSTDIGGIFSPDSFAAANNLLITDMNAAKEIAAALTNGENVALHSDFACKNKPAIFCENADKGICISTSAKKPFTLTLNLIPRNIVLGIGCKKGTDCGTISEFVGRILSTAEIDFRRVCEVASIDLKKDEGGLLDFCKSLGVELRTFSAEELSGVQGEFTASAFVSSVTGVDNVCERSAVMAGGELILRKCAENGVTVAVAELPVELDFEKEIF
ncbi:MAG: cobalt-precorrin 5A hydrolase [Oscillospiraceae bacterium]